MVTLSIPGSLDFMEPSWALVDTGSENVLAADWFADFAGVDLYGQAVALGGSASTPHGAR